MFFITHGEIFFVIYIFYYFFIFYFIFTNLFLFLPIYFYFLLNSIHLGKNVEEEILFLKRLINHNSLKKHVKKNEIDCLDSFKDKKGVVPRELLATNILERVRDTKELKRQENKKQEKNKKRNFDSTFLLNMEIGKMTEFFGKPGGHLNNNNENVDGRNVFGNNYHENHNVDLLYHRNFNLPIYHNNGNDLFLPRSPIINFNQEDIYFDENDLNHLPFDDGNHNDDSLEKKDDDNEDSFEILNKKQKK